MTRRSSLIVAGTLCCLFTVATSASAECAWVFWASGWDPKTKVATPYRPIEGFSTREACVQTRTRWKTTIEKGEKLLWGKDIPESERESRPDPICLPDTVDPRGAKGK